jgi:D-3-phosphoglycerate dehydrogenase
LLVASRQPLGDLAEERAAVEAVGARVITVETPDRAALLTAARDADLVLNRFWGRFDADVIGQLGRCRAIVQPSTGYDLIDVDAANERGVVVINLPFQCIDEVANHALALFLALNRKLNEGMAEVRTGKWNPRDLLPIGPITGEVWGSLGFGNIARHTIRRAQAFDLDVIAYDPYVDPALARELNVELVGLDDLLRRSDYVSCHLPHNPRTHHFMGEARFRLMKPSAIFINTARGKVVDEAALIKALQNGWISGAGLDVLEQEPPSPDNPLLHLDHVIVTPHLAGTSNATPPRQRRQTIESIVAYLTGEKPAGLVNPQAWEAAQEQMNSR